MVQVEVFNPGCLQKATGERGYSSERTEVNALRPGAATR